MPQLPFIGQVIMFGGNFAPVDWALCDGHLLSIAEYSALFNLIGTTYGGDGQQTFAVPDLRGRVPVYIGGTNNYVLGEQGGVESVTLTAAQTPNHTHTLLATEGGTAASTPVGNLLGSSQVEMYTKTLTSKVNMAANMISIVGGQPHTNLQPFLCLNFIIALNGVYPSQG